MSLQGLLYSNYHSVLVNILTHFLALYTQTHKRVPYSHFLICLHASLTWPVISSLREKIAAIIKEHETSIYSAPSSLSSYCRKLILFCIELNPPRTVNVLKPIAPSLLPSWKSKAILQMEVYSGFKYCLSSDSHPTRSTYKRFGDEDLKLCWRRCPG